MLFHLLESFLVSGMYLEHGNMKQRSPVDLANHTVAAVDWSLPINTRNGLMSKRPTVVFKYGSTSRSNGEVMSVATTGSSDFLQAEVVNIKMDINDDDEDVIIATVSITNEAPFPMGGLDVSVITNLGAKHYSKEGVTSLGPGIQRDWTFEFPLDSGEWTFVPNGSSEEIKMGPFAFDFEYSATQGRKLSSNIGSSLFTGAFDQKSW